VGVIIDQNVHVADSTTLSFPVCMPNDTDDQGAGERLVGKPP